VPYFTTSHLRLLFFCSELNLRLNGFCWQTSLGNTGIEYVMIKGFNSQQGERFCPHCGNQKHSGNHPASCSLDIRISFSGGKKLGLEADHSPPPSSEFKNAGVIPPFPHTSSWSCAYCLSPEDTEGQGEGTGSRGTPHNWYVMWRK
jgi:hypothetical protein